jgi:hypothetical protein
MSPSATLCTSVDYRVLKEGNVFRTRNRMTDGISEAIRNTKGTLIIPQYRAAAWH